jgi:predicted kinase
VRAVVSLTRARQTKDEARERYIAALEAYLAEATAYLQPAPPRLIAVGGLSGSGKTTLAKQLAPKVAACPGALHIRTDVERKRHFGVSEFERLPPETYTRESSRIIYSIVLEKARSALEAGQTVIVDAVFQQESERAAVEAVATTSGAAFTGLWLEANRDALVERVDGRRVDASDATAAVVTQQLEQDPGPISWAVVDAGGPPDAVLKAVLATRVPGQND